MSQTPASASPLSRSKLVAAIVVAAAGAAGFLGYWASGVHEGQPAIAVAASTTEREVNDGLSERHNSIPFPAAPAGGAIGGAPFPAEIGGAFRLTNQFGETRTERDPDGKPQLLFFGFATCEAICLVALPRMGEAVDLLAQDGLAVRPVMITVDPENDTPETMGAALSRHHESFIGLTGEPDALNAAQDAFHVQSEKLGETPDGVPIYAHGSFIYLLDAEGRFLTLMPPILGPERIAEITRGYL